MPRPPFLEVVINDLTNSPSLTALCAGFEQGQWRGRQLAKRLLEAVPAFALTHDERSEFDDSTGVELMGLAVSKVYLSDKYQRRGEFGELLLYVALEEVFGAVPAISKLYFKDSSNDTVKGFDSVHVVAPDAGELELWLGEVKFYKDLTSAVRDVVAELHDHLGEDFLRWEFAAIRGKLERDWEHTPALLDLLHHRTSLDEVFTTVTVPVLLTYESPAVADRVVQLGAPGAATPSATAQAYKDAFTKEAQAALARFMTAGPPTHVRIRLLLMPLHLKQALLSDLDERLKAWQRATQD